ncbi:AbrB/MazE/SpoVT family DNA-binding domain-containing protein [Candidatus Woesearchaeota archaeon]|nr:AbrB/MazE/SpoVT family DNA-binding domain-containing protein [Candidatus Woesearchaeota archaeon]
MSMTKVTRNYQITVPRDVREMANIKEGDKLVITMEKGEIKMKKFDEDIFKRAFGSWKNAGIKDSVKYVRDIRKEWEHRAKRLGLR